MPRRSAARQTAPRPAARGAMTLVPPAARKRTGGQSNMEELFDLGGRFDRNELSRAEIDRLRQMIDERGAHPVAAELGLAASTLLMACAGFGHRLAPKTAARLREYLR